MLAVLFFRLLRLPWPETILCLFISGYVALFGNPNLVLRAVSYASADAYQVFFHANKKEMHPIDQEAMNEVIKSFRVKLENDTSLTK